MSAAILVLGLALFAAWRCYRHNDGVVVTGELYRTAQLDGPQLRAEIQSLHLRSVVNLRGPNIGTPWYTEELAICRQMGIAHADVRISAKHLPSPSQVAALLDIYRKLPRPMLIHCNSGSDRTGLASTIYLIDQKGLSPTEAARALGWRFGHFAIYPYFYMNEFIELYGGENPQNRSFSQWVLHDYPGVYADEAKETTWDEMLEPFKSLANIQYWRHNGS